MSTERSVIKPPDYSPWFRPETDYRTSRVGCKAIIIIIIIIISNSISQNAANSHFIAPSIKRTTK